MEPLINLRAEAKQAKRKVLFFKNVRLHLNEAAQKADEYGLVLNEEVMIKKLCQIHNVPFEEYMETHKLFQDYLTYGK